MVSQTVEAMSGRLIGQQLQDLMTLLAANGDRLPADAVVRFARLITAVSSLHDEHPADVDGRCLLCRSTRRRWPRRAKPCSIRAAVDIAVRPSFADRATTQL
jgi:hypothetical protein